MHSMIATPSDSHPKTCFCQTYSFVFQRIRLTEAKGLWRGRRFWQNQKWGRIALRPHSLVFALRILGETGPDRPTEPRLFSDG